MKKIKKSKQNQKVKLEKTCAKTQEQTQLYDIKRLAIDNIQIRTYKNILSDFVNILSSNTIEKLNIFFLIIQTLAII